jgi:RNA polymerase sigma-70 factor, ECF subfamily
MDDERARTDRELAERISRGDGAALEAVYDAYAGAVYRQALAVASSAADAEDVVQEVFLKLVRRRGGPIRDLKAYLLTAARNQATSTLRQRRCEALDDCGLRIADCGFAGRPYPQSTSSATVDMAAVREALEALPSEQREVVMLKVYDQLTFEEIGRVVRASLNTVASRYRYALQKLRKALGDAVDG